MRNAGTVVVIDWTDKAKADRIAPDTDQVINVGRAEAIAVQVDTYFFPGHLASSVGLLVESSVDGAVFDTVPWAKKEAVAADVIDTLAVAPGPQFIRLRLDNNDAGADAYVRARVSVIG